MSLSRTTMYCTSSSCKEHSSKQVGAAGTQSSQQRAPNTVSTSNKTAVTLAQGLSNKRHRSQLLLPTITPASNLLHT
jgi:hypothetical protein